MKGNLVLTRKAGESLMIGDSVEVRVLSIRAGKVRVAVLAPEAVPILRGELQNKPRPPAASTPRSKPASPPQSTPAAA